MISTIKNNPKRLFTVLNVLIIAMIVVVIMFFIRDGVKYFTKNTIKPPQKPPQKAQLPSQSDLMSYNIVVKNNLFGIKSDEIKQIKPTDAGSEKHADSDYKLIGTIAGADKYSFAIFISRDGSQEIFKVGSSIG
ncbi:MAG: hypothetical protein N2738_06550, partial [Thermodesulfovibrionales bacterium]|nr:hypothetical protein [Thermodesulfovibrionales bacterium]